MKEPQSGNLEGAPLTREEFLQTLREKKAEVEQEMRRQNEAWRRQIDALEHVIAIYSEGKIHDPRTKPRRSATLSARLRGFAISEITKANRPLHRSEILERAHNAGIFIEAKDPAKFLTRVLWRAKELVNEGDGYQLAERPHEKR